MCVCVWYVLVSFCLLQMIYAARRQPLENEVTKGSSEGLHYIFQSVWLIVGSLFAKIVAAHYDYYK